MHLLSDQDRPPHRHPTPRLRIRMVGREHATFRAASLEEFQDRYQAALESPAGSVIRRHRDKVFERLHVYESGYGEGWAMIHSVLTTFVGIANRAVSGHPSQKYFPQYNFHSRVHHYGGPRPWIYSAEGLWILSQATWAWGRELTRFLDGAVGEMLKNIHREAEDKSGTYNLRPTLPHEAN